jgi:antitoxin ParD1/3/4
MVGMAGSARLTIAVTPELEAFIRERVTSGRFDSASDVVHEGLRLLEEREHARDAELQEIRREIEVGLEQAKAGRLRDGDEFFAELAQKRPSSAQ